MSSMDDFFKSRKTGMTPREASKSEGSIPKGMVERKIYGNYHDMSATIANAQIANPNDPDNSNYDQHKIFESLERNAEMLVVTNDNPLGGATLFAIISHSGGQHFSQERPIYPQEMKTFYNVYEMRLRSPSQGSPYRVTEYDLHSMM